MALPKLNDSPIYNLTIPSSKKRVKFRPYLVKEEKVLMMAAESGDLKQAANAVIDTVIACLSDPVSKQELSTFDVEYMFTQIRSKSVGENIEFNMPCEECDVKTDVNLSLSDLKVKVPTKWNAPITLTPEVSVEMKFPSYSELVDTDVLTEEGAVGTETAFKLAAKCINAIVHNDERYLAEDSSEEEMIEFLESMDTKQFEKVLKFINNIPKLTHTLEWNCVGCGEKKMEVLEGLNSFF